MKRSVFLAALLAAAAIAVPAIAQRPDAPGGGKDKASGGIDMTVHTHNSVFRGPGGAPLLAGETDPLEYPISEQSFSYSSVACASRRRHIMGPLGLTRSPVLDGDAVSPSGSARSSPTHRGMIAPRRCKRPLDTTGRPEHLYVSSCALRAFPVLYATNRWVQADEQVQGVLEREDEAQRIVDCLHLCPAESPSRWLSTTVVCSTSTRVSVPSSSITGRNVAGRALADVGATSAVLSPTAALTSSSRTCRERGSLRT